MKPYFTKLFSKAVHGLVNKASTGFSFSVANVPFYGGIGNWAAPAGPAASCVVIAGGAYCRRKKEAGEKLPWFLNKFADGMGRLGEPFPADLRIAAVGSLEASFVSFCTPGMWMYGVAALCYASGGFLAVSEKVKALQFSQTAKGVTKLLTHPALYYGLADSTFGLVAGGGMNLLTHPFNNIPALASATMGISIIAFSAAGVLAKKFTNSAAPFMLTTLGTFINAMAAVPAGKWSAVAAGCLGTVGVFRLAVISYQEDKARQAAREKEPESLSSSAFVAKPKAGVAHKIFDALSSALVYPLDVLARRGVIPVSKPVASCSAG